MDESNLISVRVFSKISKLKDSRQEMLLAFVKVKQIYDNLRELRDNKNKMGGK